MPDVSDFCLPSDWAKILGLTGHEYWDEYWESEAQYSWPIGRGSGR